MQSAFGVPARLVRRALGTLALGVVIAHAPAHAQDTARREALPPAEGYYVPVETSALRVHLRHQPPPARLRQRHAAPVLFIHGSTFPSGLAAAFEFDGVSWMDHLAARGFDVWALDFLGYGKADRYPEMREPPGAHPALGRAPEAARQIAAAVRFIAAHRAAHRHAAPRDSVRVSLVAHSWGTIPAGRYAGEHPNRIERLVLFGPVAQRDGPADTAVAPAYWFVTDAEQRTRFEQYVPKGEAPVLEPRHFAAWGPAYLASDSSSGTRNPASVAVPNGPGADVGAAWSGHLPYDPAKITAPVLIVRGEWDTVTRDADASWLYRALSHAPLKRDVKIDRGTHVMHLERSRHQLYAEVAAFLAADDAPPSPPPGTRALKIVGLGTLTGPVRSFGTNSRAALHAAADSIDRTGGVRLADGTIGRFEISYVDDRCAPGDGIARLREAASSAALAVVGPSCSSVAQPLYGALARTARTAYGRAAGADTDGGIRIPVLTDGATQADLARISEWAFRNVPDERAMYRALWAWVRRRYPTLRTFYGGEEADFAHSHSSYANIIAPEARAAGLSQLGEVGWSIGDTAFAEPVAAIRAAQADIVVIAAHSRTTCGVLGEMHRRGVRPRLVVGLTSASSAETLRSCAADADGLLIPTTFAPTTPAARAAAAAVARQGGIADLHSMAAWELLFALRRVIERSPVLGKPETAAADRLAIRNGFARLARMPGLLGAVRRTADRESEKPFVLVQVSGGRWRVVAD